MKSTEASKSAIAMYIVQTTLFILPLLYYFSSQSQVLPIRFQNCSTQMNNRYQLKRNCLKFQIHFSTTAVSSSSIVSSSERRLLQRKRFIFQGESLFLEVSRISAKFCSPQARNLNLSADQLIATDSKLSRSLRPVTAVARLKTIFLVSIYAMFFPTDVEALGEGSHSPYFTGRRTETGLTHNLLWVVWLVRSRAGTITRPHNLKVMLYIC